MGNTYAIERELGGGGMSRVFLATETALDRPVVLKLLPSELASGVSTDRFRQEIRLAARLQPDGQHFVLASGGAGENRIAVVTDGRRATGAVTKSEAGR